MPSGGGAPGGLLADIRGGARLKKVSAQDKKDRSAALVPGKEDSAPAASGSGAGADAGGGLAGALASALAARKSKVSHSGELAILFCHVLTHPRTDYDLQTTKTTRMIGKSLTSWSNTSNRKCRKPINLIIVNAIPMYTKPR